LGGKARYFVEVTSDAEVDDALRWADDAHVNKVLVLGGGSNLVVSDSGTRGLVIRAAQKGVSLEDRGNVATLSANAGESWDSLVQFSVERELVGLECLSGIPGTVGATPVQNVGAYGQEVSQTLSAVTVFDRQNRKRVTFTRDECRLSYRDSRFKTLEPDRYIVLNVEFRLNRGEPAPVRHRELVAQLAEQRSALTDVGAIRQAVLALRKQKSLLADPEDRWARSAGSFFVNPIVSKEQAESAQSRRPELTMPRWEMADGRVKLAAAWLIEQSGFHHGYHLDRVGLSPHHCLIVVAHEYATCTDVIRFARHIRDVVLAKFGIFLVPEPRFWGFERFESGLPTIDEEGPTTHGSSSCLLGEH
jgi:UDP-N-acetylmuramate dehydrogenase